MFKWNLKQKKKRKKILFNARKNTLKHTKTRKIPKLKQNFSRFLFCVTINNTNEPKQCTKIFCIVLIMIKKQVLNMLEWN